MRATASLRTLLLFIGALYLTSTPIAAQLQLDQHPRMLAYAVVDLSAVSPQIAAMKTGPRIGVVVCHFPSGWGGGYAYQRLAWRGEGVPTSDPYSLFMYTHSTPQGRLSAHSFMAIKEITLRSTPTVRPSAEAGISFVRFEQGVLVTTELLYGQTDEFRADRSTNSVGCDLRLRALFAVCRAFGFEIAAHTNINPEHSYSSFEFGFAVGLVRPPRLPNNSDPQ